MTKRGRTSNVSKRSSPITMRGAAPASTPVPEPKLDSQRTLELLGRCDALARVDAASKELERQTLIAFFDHLAGRLVDPRITRRFAQQSSGWRVPWSRSVAQVATVEKNVLLYGDPAGPDQVAQDAAGMSGRLAPGPVTVPLDGDRGYVRLSAARSLRG